MSPRSWLCGLASGGATLIGGVGLGLYATTPPRTAFSYDDPAPTTQSVETVPESDLNGPVEVRCTGCGPTLAQRQMTEMMGGWDGYSDPVVQHYEVQQEAPQNLLNEPVDPPPSPVHQLPGNIDRFAAGEGVPAPVQTIRGASVSDTAYQAEKLYP